jgi:hypothetical protein
VRQRTDVSQPPRRPACPFAPLRHRPILLPRALML